VNERLEAERGALDPAAMADILGDTGSASCRIRDSIAMVMTVGSVVFRPDDGTVWVGTGEAPTSRGEFVPFSLERSGAHPERGAITVGADEREEDRDAFEAFRQTYIAYVDDEDPRRALSLTTRATELAPDQPLYHALRGLLALNCGDAAAAEVAFDRAIELSHPDPERVAGFHLWRARARDLLGDRDGALREYRWAIGHRSDPQVREAALRGLKRRYTESRARRVHIDIGLADVVAP
jgi:tetratricopeptide (TPR) repeat protein